MMGEYPDFNQDPDEDGNLSFSEFLWFSYKNLGAILNTSSAFSLLVQVYVTSRLSPEIALYLTCDDAKPQAGMWMQTRDLSKHDQSLVGQLTLGACCTLFDRTHVACLMCLFCE